MSDLAEDICDAIVTYLKAQTFEYQGVIRRTDNPLGDLQHETLELSVLVHATEEEAEKIGRGGQCLERFAMSVLVVRKLDVTFTKSNLAGYARAVKTALRGQTMAGCTWSGDTTNVKSDFRQLDELGQFCSVFQVVYSKIFGP